MPIKLLTTGPSPTITLSEHAQLTATTPASFSDIPPVCVKKEEGVVIKFSWNSSEGSTNGGGASESGSGVEGWTVRSEDALEGTLYVQQNALEFYSSARSMGLSIPWPCISLHAISRRALRPSSSPVSVLAPTTNGDTALSCTERPCLYCQIDERLENAQADGGFGRVGRGEGEEEWGETKELVIVPSDSNSLETLFEAFSQCAASHPSVIATGDGDDAFIEGPDGGDEEELSEVGRVRGDFVTPDTRFTPY